MKVKDLKKLLEDADENLDVRVIADHGQVAMLCNTASEEYIDSDEYMAEHVHPDAVDEETDVKVFLIGD